MVCYRLIKPGFLFFTKNVMRNTMSCSLKFSRMTNTGNLVYLKHFSVATSNACQPANPTKIKKQSGTPSIKDSFQSQFFKYLRDNGSFHCCSPNNNSELLQKPLKKLTDGELPVYIASVINAGKLTERLRQEIDEECASRLPRLSTDSVLKLVDAWLYNLPHILNKLKFYRNAMHMFEYVLTSEDVNQPAFIQTYFYVSLCSDKALAKELIKNALDKIQASHSLIGRLSLEELAMISLSTFRTSNVISSRMLLQAISDCIKANLETLLKADVFFVTLVKPLRPALFYDLKLLDSIAAKLPLLESKLFVTKVQIFTLFSQSLYYNKDFLQRFADIIGSDLLYLLENKKTMDVRMKDVSRFLWGLNYLGVTPSVKNLDIEVIEKINDWIDFNDFEQSNMHWLITMMCSIFMFRWDYEQLFQKVFATFPPHELNVPNHPRNRRNLNLLISCLNIEAPHLVSEDLLEVLEPTGAVLAKKHLLSRPVLRNVYKTAWLLKNRQNIQDILCHFNVPFLLILGVSFYTPKGSLLHVEVLDSTVCLLTSNIPIGMMSLKLRLLNHMKAHVLIIDSTKLGKDNNFLLLLGNKIREIDGAS